MENNINKIYIDNSFEKNDMKIALSEYYINIIKDMVSQLLSSIPWKRKWVNADTNNKWWYYDYRCTQRSTFPDWSKFFFEKSIFTNKYEKGNNEILENWKILVEKKFNWNSKELISILEKSLVKDLTERQWNALEQAFENFNDYMNNYYEMYQEEYIRNEDNLIIFYDEGWNFNWFRIEK